jgi:hypothetical protein
VDGVVVIPEGAQATGSIVDAAKKKFFGFGGKMTFSLHSVDAVDGSKLPIRVTPGGGNDGPSKRAFSASGPKPKDIAVAAGSEFMGYIDGTQSVMVKQ